MEILLAVFITASNILCFMLGAKVGQKVDKGEPVELPNLNPVTAYRQYEASKEAKREQERLDTIMQNIDNYDGTPFGQKEVR